MKTQSPPARAVACGTAPTAPSFEKSRVLRHNGAGWDGVRAVAEHDASGVRTVATHRTLAQMQDAGFELRYHEIETAGETWLEARPGVRILLGQRGRGRLSVGGEELEVGYGDIVRIGHGEACRLSNPNPEPFGFICVVGADRHPERVLEDDRADA